jgi:uncharacterized protein (TIRG00374 family)
MQVKKRLQLFLGIFVSLVFSYLALRKIAVSDLIDALKGIRSIYLIPSLIVIFTGHWLRSIRWRYLLKPVKQISTGALFSALMVGYLGNTVLPAHIGELFRAYLIGRNARIPKSAVLATIFVERIIDVYSLLILMFVTVFMYPLPEWVSGTAIIVLVLTSLLTALLIALKMKTNLFVRLLDVLPARICLTVQRLLKSFLYGFTRLESGRDYVCVGILSMVIWLSYWAVLHINFHTFQFSELSAVSSLVLLVTTTIAVLIPSSPGYVGTYHYLCQTTLALFGVPLSESLAYAIVVHGLNVFSLFVVGLIFAWKEGVTLMSMSATNNDYLNDGISNHANLEEVN